MSHFMAALPDRHLFDIIFEKRRREVGSDSNLH